jgi:hypothetical protein
VFSASCTQEVNQDLHLQVNSALNMLTKRASELLVHACHPLDLGSPTPHTAVNSGRPPAGLIVWGPVGLPANLPPSTLSSDTETEDSRMVSACYTTGAKFASFVIHF